MADIERDSPEAVERSAELEGLNALDIYQATVMLCSDRPPQGVTLDSILFHGRSYKDYDGLLSLVAGLCKSGRAKSVSINGSEGQRFGGQIPGEAWPGRTRLEKALRWRWLGIKDIHPTAPSFNTRQDTDVFIELAKNYGWKTVGILTQPHQILRAMLGTVRAMEQTGYWMRVYALTPERTDWFRRIQASQGQTRPSRFADIYEELKRIPKYQAKGDLATFDELFKYFRTRDQIK